MPVNSAKLPANALFFAIAIALVIALLCSSLIFTAYYHRLQVHQQQTRERVLRNADSGIALLLATASQETDSSAVVDLFGEMRDSVFLRKTNWGLLQAGYVRAYSGKAQVSRSFLLGTVPDTLWKGALYMVDQGRPISLAGNTLLKGTVWLPEAGAQRGNVNGKNFEREKLVEGQVRKSRNRLPALNTSFLTSMLRQVSWQHKGETQPLSLLQQDSLVVSFADPVCRIQSNGRPMVLDRVLVKGHVILSSDTLIEVSASARLENILLSAPVIRFAKGFKGTLQAFATDSLIAGEECRFRYPSAFGLLEIDSVDNSPRIVLRSGCQLEGMLFQHVSFIDRSRASTHLYPKAVLKGQAYVEGMTVLEGTIQGTLVCEKFWLQTPASSFENHLYDAVIDRSALSPHFLGSPLFSDNLRKIAAWLP